MTPDWAQLWSALYHQGTVYPASFAALPRLADLAASTSGAGRSQALILAGAIVGAPEPPRDLGDVRVRYADAIATLLRLARHDLPRATDRVEYVYLCQAVLAFEGHEGGHTLFDGLVNEELDAECPHCAAAAIIKIGQDGCSTVPVDPASLTGLSRRLHDEAVTHGHREVAVALRHLYGHITCGACGGSFSGADQVKEWPAGRS